MCGLDICFLQEIREILQTNENTRGLHIQVKLQAHVRASWVELLKKGAERDV